MHQCNSIQALQILNLPRHKCNLCKKTHDISYNDFAILILFSSLAEVKLGKTMMQHTQLCYNMSILSLHSFTGRELTLQDRHKGFNIAL